MVVVVTCLMPTHSYTVKTPNHGVLFFSFSFIVFSSIIWFNMFTGLSYCAMFIRLCAPDTGFVSRPSYKVTMLRLVVSSIASWNIASFFITISNILN